MINDTIKTEEKQCTKCKTFKPTTTNYFGRCSRYGFQSQCKQCKRESYYKNREEISKKRKEDYRKLNPVEVLPKGQKRCASCREVKGVENFGKLSKAKDGLRYSCNECRKSEYLDNKEHYLEYQREYNANNRKRIAIATKRYKQKNKEWYRDYHREYYKENKKRIIENVRVYRLNRSRKDINFRLIARYRTRVYKALKGMTKSESTLELIGCSIEELKQHLENKFQEGMSWGNYGEWHVDHIIPCSSFDMTNEKERLECFNYRNLQPLWADDNLRKSDNIN